MPKEPLARAERYVRARLTPPRLSRLKPGDLRQVRHFVGVIDDCVAELNRAAGFSGELAFLIRSSVVSSAFPALVKAWHKDLEQVRHWTVRAWKEHAAQLGAPLQTGEEEREFLYAWNLAVAEHFAAQVKDRRGPLLVQRLMSALDLSQDELGRMLGVTGESIRRWKTGASQIPPARMAALVSAEAALKRLLEMFRPEMLPQAVRRKAELFEGRRALDWILDGRIAEVADRYESALAYQA